MRELDLASELRRNDERIRRCAVSTVLTIPDMPLWEFVASTKDLE
jgi:hypothetical protein